MGLNRKDTLCFCDTKSCKFVSKVLAAHNTISSAWPSLHCHWECCFSRNVSSRLLDWAALGSKAPGSFIGRGAQGHGQESDWKKRMTSWMKDLTTQIVSVPFYRWVREGVGPDWKQCLLTPIFQIWRLLLVPVQPLHVLQMLRNEVLLRRQRATLCTSLHLAATCIKGHTGLWNFYFLLVVFFSPS